MGTTRVKRLRGKADWTQGELAKKSGVDQGTVSRTEKGKAPGVVTALRLAKALDTTVEVLFGDLLRAADARKKEREQKRESRRVSVRTSRAAA